MKKKIKNPYLVKKTPDEIKGFCDCLMEHKGQQKNDPSIIFCDKIQYLHNRSKDRGVFDHHLFFWKGKELIFKIYLPNEFNDEEFKDVDEALKSVGIKRIEIKD